MKSGITENGVGWTFTCHPPCHYYDCAKCPYLEYPFCTYERYHKKEND